MASSTLKTYQTQFREDIAEQLRDLGEGDVTVRPDRVVLELESAGEGLVRIVAGLNEDDVGRPGWADWVQLRIENQDRKTPLLTLAWFDVDGDGGFGALETRVNPHLPLDARGLNASADIREGPYRRGDALHLLRADLGGASGRPASRSSRALTRMDAPPRFAVVRTPARESPPDDVVDAEFEPVTPAQTRGNEAPSKARIPPLAELREMLVAETFEALQHELLSREATRRGAGALSSVKASVLEALEWAMLGTAYAVDAVTSRTAIGTFLPGNASWLYGLVGPVLIGGLGSLARGRFDRAVAFGLMTSWAVFVGLVTASDETYLSGAQGWFPKGARVRAQEESLNLARLDQTAAEKEVARLQARAGADVTAAFTVARRRWQAQEIRKAAETERREGTAALQAAQASLKEAAAGVVSKEAALKQAMLEDPSRAEAWGALLAIFTIINFAGPYGITRVLGKWRSDHASTKADAEKDHHAREGAKLLRRSHGVQKARAMRLAAEAIAKRSQDGIASEVLNQINGEEIADIAAARFDRSINPEKYRPRWRLPGLSRN
jgi:hypothetical protein